MGIQNNYRSIVNEVRNLKHQYFIKPSKKLYNKIVKLNMKLKLQDKCIIKTNNPIKFVTD